MDEHARTGVVRRLQSISGHVRGIQRMVEEDQYCIDIVKQVDAVQAALAKVNLLIIDQHVRNCVTTAIQGSDPERREAVIGELLDVFALSKRDSPPDD
jgi:CsoR family transcriptional regulator, copper-sensing transcriptional repressor